MPVAHELALQLDPLCNDYIFWFEAPPSEEGVWYKSNRECRVGLA